MPLDFTCASILVGFTTAYADALHHAMPQNYLSALRVIATDRLVIAGLTRSDASAEVDQATDAVANSPSFY